MNELIKTIIENCHLYIDRNESEKCEKIILNAKNELRKQIEKLTDIKFYLTEKFKGKFVFIYAYKKNDVDELKRIITNNNLNLYCSSFSYNQLNYYKKLALNNKNFIQMNVHVIIV